MDSANNFEKNYLQLRERENRLMTDEEVKVLPYLKQGPHVNEWKLRAKTSERFMAYLQKKKQVSNILEIGCGNGWFTHQMALHTKAMVIGTDVNRPELEQARDLFEDDKTRFVEFDLTCSVWKGPVPDIIVFNASIQYFPNLTDILSKALLLTHSTGEIHILDSPFYKQAEILPARQRSTLYFDKMKVPEMKTFYYHHCIDDLNPFNPKFFYTPPRFLFNKFIKDSPFYWIYLSPNQ